MNIPLPLMLPVFPIACFRLPARLFHRISTGSSSGIRWPVRGCFMLITIPRTGLRKKLSAFPSASQVLARVTHGLSTSAGGKPP
jgi:hypothetical protein